METRASLYATAQRQAEDTRVRIRKTHQASVKRGKFGKHSIELDEVCSSFTRTNRIHYNLFRILVPKAHRSTCR